MGIVLGIDSSTQSCTVEFRDADTGNLFASARTPHPQTHPPVSEQDPKAWWEALVQAVQTALKSGPVRAREVSAISVAAQGHGLVALDDKSNVIRPVKLWNDTTSAPNSAAMVERMGIETWAQLIGSVPTAAFTISKLAWLAEHEPANLARIRTVLLPADWVTYRMTGRAMTERSNASGTGYYSAANDQWLTDVLATFVSADVDWAASLPTVVEPALPAGDLTNEAAEQLGLPPGIPVGPGANDQAAAFLGLGMTAGDVLFSLGTSGVVMTSCPQPVHDTLGRFDGVSDAAGGFLPLGCTLNATKVTDTIARLLHVDWDQMATMALIAPDDPDRPVLAAFFDGERTPNRPNATGILAGLTNDTTRESLARAAYEGVLLGLIEAEHIIRSAGVETRGATVVAGGGARSVAYRQLLADLRNRPVIRLDAPEATARGAAVQAAAVLRQANVLDVARAWQPSVVDETFPRHAQAEAIRSRYQRLAEWPDMDRSM